MSSRSVEILAVEGPRWWVTKPAGIPVFPPHQDPDGDCVLAQLLGLLPGRHVGWPEGFAGGIAHRLDTATSGLLLVARAPEDLPGIRAEFAAHRLRKFYEFRAAPAPGADPYDGGVIDVAIAHHRRRSDRMVVWRGDRTAHRGRWYPAWTRITWISAPRRWEAEIHTGVMHQIRVHAAFAGLPLDGDAVYGGGPGPFCLHHREMWGDGWRSPIVVPPFSSPVAPSPGGPWPGESG